MAPGPAPAEERLPRSRPPAAAPLGGRGAASSALPAAARGRSAARSRCAGGLFREGVLASHAAAGAGDRGRQPDRRRRRQDADRDRGRRRCCARPAGAPASSRAAMAATTRRCARSRRRAKRAGSATSRCCCTGAPACRSSSARDRVAAAHALLHAHPDVDVLVADDGLQHLALGRDIEVIVFDDRGAGNGWLLPAGPLREPLPRTLHEHRSCSTTPAPRRRPCPASSAARALAGVAALAAWWRGEPPSAAALEALRGRHGPRRGRHGAPGRFFAMLREPASTSSSCRCPTTTTSAPCPGRRRRPTSSSPRRTRSSSPPAADRRRASGWRR